MKSIFGNDYFIYILILSLIIFIVISLIYDFLFNKKRREFLEKFTKTKNLKLKENNEIKLNLKFNSFFRKKVKNYNFYQTDDFLLFDSIFWTSSGKTGENARITSIKFKLNNVKKDFVILYILHHHILLNWHFKKSIKEFKLSLALNSDFGILENYILRLKENEIWEKVLNQNMINLLANYIKINKIHILLFDNELYFVSLTKFVNNENNLNKFIDFAKLFTEKLEKLN